MKKIALIIFSLLLSAYGFSQTVDEIVRMKSPEVKRVLDSLPLISNMPKEGWINSPSANPLSSRANGLKVIHFGSFENNISRYNIETLDKLQRQLPQISFLLVGNSPFDYPSARDYKTLLTKHNIALPFLPDSIASNISYGAIDQNNPTTIILTPDNHIIQTYKGLLNIDHLATDLVRLRDVLIVFYQMTPTPFLGKTPNEFSKRSIIECPTGIAVDAKSERIFVSDYCANRILILSPYGELIDAIGTGKPGNKTGPLSQAQLNGPRGLAYDNENKVLYIADSRNNCIKKIDWKTIDIEVTTIKTSEYFSQPENLSFKNGQLFISAHAAIWQMNTESLEFEVIYNELVNASANNITQPAGISIMDNGVLVLTDNLESSVKYIDNGEINSPVSKGDFGYADGKKDKVKFYFPNGIAAYDGGFLIADTYNNRIRWYDPFKRKSKTIAGNGEQGFYTGNALNSSFNKPLDIAILDDVAYITDSGSGLIRILDLKNGSVSNMSISNYSKVSFGYNPPIKDFRNGDTLFVASGKNNISLKLNLSENYEADMEGYSQASATTRSVELLVTDNLMNDMTIEFDYNSDASENPTADLLVEYILFFKSKTHPELQYKRTVSYLFPIVHSTKVETSIQKIEFTFDPDGGE